MKFKKLLDGEVFFTVESINTVLEYYDNLENTAASFYGELESWLVIECGDGCVKMINDPKCVFDRSSATLMQLDPLEFSGGKWNTTENSPLVPLKLCFGDLSEKCVQTIADGFAVLTAEMRDYILSEKDNAAADVKYKVYMDVEHHKLLLSVEAIPGDIAVITE